MSDKNDRVFVGYGVLTYGPKHTRLELRERPGARSQMQSIEAFTAPKTDREPIWWFDHARKLKGPEVFPLLIEMLRRLEAAGTGEILVDGAERLFSALSPDGRAQMWDFLQPHLSRILDLRRRRKLSEFQEKELFAVLYNGVFTTNARRISKLARGKKADIAARAVLDLRDEFACAGNARSNLALAREANARGLRTSRGNEWSDVAVARALNRPAGASITIDFARPG